jgi:DNA polymerase-3 subunit gamma/tau
VAVAEASAAGWDAQRLAAELVEQLRWGFLATMAPKLVPLTDEARQRVDEQARQLGPAALVRGVELVGQALVDMRDALDPRATLEVALVRLARPDADHSPEALLERIEGLERRLSSGGPATPTGGGSPAAPPQPKPEPSASGAPPAAKGGDPGGRAALGAVRRQARSAGDSPGDAAGDPPGDAAGGSPPGPPTRGARPSASQPPPASAPAPNPGAGQPDRDELVKAWGDSVLSGLKGRARARFRAGRFVAAQDGVATFALPDEIHRSYSDECRVDVEMALRAHFGVPIRLRLVVDDDSPSVPASQTTSHQTVADDPPDPDELTDAPPGSTSVEARLLETFPGAREVPGMTATPPGPDR